MTFGLTEQGFVPMRRADVWAAYLDFFRGIVDIANAGPFGQFIGLLADREAALWEIADAGWSAGFAGRASGVAKDLASAIGGIPRLGARATVVQATIVGTPGTSFVAGQSIAKTTDNAAQFTPVADFVIPVGGSITVAWQCTSTGPTQCLAGKLTSIVTPIAGWTSITNALDGDLGANVETDAAYDVRKLKAFSTVVSSSSPGLLRALLSLTGVLEARIIDNTSDSPDADGRPGHSFETVVRGGADQDIIDTIFRIKASGIATCGSSSGSSIDLHGDAQPINFSRPTQVPIFVTAVLTVTPQFPADGIARVLSAILGYGQNQLKMGQVISAFPIQQAIIVPGIETCDVSAGLTAAGQVPDPLIPIAKNAIGVFDSSRITVTRAN